MYFCGLKTRRGVAQLVARYVRDVEAGSSSLLTPTYRDAVGVSFFCPSFFVFLLPVKSSAMKKFFLLISFLAFVLVGPAQTQHMKFMGVDLNCTMSTFMSKLKGKGFVQDVNNSRDNLVYMKGTFAGEKVKLEIRCATKTHLVYSVMVCFNMSTSFNYETLKTQLEKYGTDTQEFKNVNDDEGYVKYATDYMVWNTDKDPETGFSNKIVLTKCSYRGTSPYVISYIDRRNSLLDVQEVSSDF